MSFALRRELLRAPLPDGGIALYDPLLERTTRLDAAEAAALDAGDPALRARLDALLLLEGSVADALRARVLAARLAAPAAPPAAAGGPRPSFAAARGLPLVAPTWRRPEAWRRAAEERAAGRDVVVLRGFLPARTAARLAAAVAAAPATRFTTDVVTAWRLTPADAALAAWRALLVSPALRALAGAVLGVPLPAALQVNAWRLDPGDQMSVHPDGRRYAATWILGLNAGWCDADGGAIAFGLPGAPGFAVRERFLPFLGDLCLFVPHAESWHRVEPPTRPRLTLSGWWVRDR